ncbi:enoyl-CoA hydratase [Antricoccus suffuscus]|uniref:Enoyl-CoA hydratase n=1 Tax=Antricoccus suffuscus TaxID=1629062 RepID=A0A2T0ZXD8_9ACTN|nr:enoyl-CoA hydratase-related protein [Antricoccus suffuscus]PRZ41022.1 enoyl-CoA hydratase [Antricoccus suffuscus]
MPDNAASTSTRKVDRTIDTGSDDILADVGGSIATITLNRPDRRNALSDAMFSGMKTLLADFEQDDDVAVVVLTGAGGAFCSGGDVKGFNERGGEGGGTGKVDPARVDRQRTSQRDTVGKIYNYTKPVIAALPGAAAGAGLGLALSADVRIGSTRAVMATAFGGVGLSGDYGTTWFLDKLVGPAKARELLWWNEKLRADDCLKLGLLNWVVEEDELEAKTYELAAKLADGPRQCFNNMKQNLIKAQNADLFDAMDLEVQLHLECGITDDHREAVAAFVEKRPAVFKH